MLFISSFVYTKFRERILQERSVPVTWLLNRPDQADEIAVRECLNACTGCDAHPIDSPSKTALQAEPTKPNSMQPKESTVRQRKTIRMRTVKEEKDNQEENSSLSIFSVYQFSIFINFPFVFNQKKK